MVSSDDESSDSSDDFLVPPDKINLNSTFFDSPVNKKSNQKKTKRIIVPSDSDESSEDFISPDHDEDDNDVGEEDQTDSAALLAEVMKNLEKANAQAVSWTRDETKKDPSPKKDKTKSLENEINDMLLQSESGLGSFEDQSDNEKEKKNNIKTEEPSTSGYKIPKDGVDIVLPGTELIFNRRQRKKEIDLEAELIKKMNQRLRKNQLFIHKVGLLCWLSHGFHLNRQINNPNVLASAMSLVPTSICPAGRIDLKYLEQFTIWFRKLVKLEFNKQDIPITSEMLLERIKKKKVHNYRELVLVYLATLRGIGINCRLVVSLCAPQMKLRQDQLFKSTKKKEDDDKKAAEKKRKKTQTTSKDVKRKKSDVQVSSVKIVPENSQEKDHLSKEEAKQRAVELLRAKFSRSTNKKSIKDIDKIVKKSSVKEEIVKKSPIKDSMSDDDIRSPKIRRLRSKTIELPKTPVTKKSLQKKKTIDIKNKSPVIVKSEEKKSTSSTSTTSTMSDSGDSSDEEIKFEPKSPPKKKFNVIENIKNEGKKRRSGSIDRRVFSDDEEESPFFNEKFDSRDSRYMWVEVYVESEENWISVNVPDGKIHCVAEIYVSNLKKKKINKNL